MSGVLASSDLTGTNCVYMQVIGPGMGEAFLKLKLKDQAKSMQILTSDPQLSHLRRLKVGPETCLCHTPPAWFMQFCRFPS